MTKSTAQFGRNPATENSVTELKNILRKSIFRVYILCDNTAKRSELSLVSFEMQITCNITLRRRL